MESEVGTKLKGPPHMNVVVECPQAKLWHLIVMQDLNYTHSRRIHTPKTMATPAFSLIDLQYLIQLASLGSHQVIFLCLN